MPKPALCQLYFLSLNFHTFRMYVDHKIPVYRLGQHQKVNAKHPFFPLSFTGWWENLAYSSHWKFWNKYKITGLTFQVTCLPTVGVSVRQNYSLLWWDTTFFRCGMTDITKMKYSSLLNFCAQSLQFSNF